MRDQERRSRLIRLIFSVISGAVLGGFLGFASAQDRPPGQLDTACLQDCAAQGQDSEFCNRLCWVANPAQSRPAEVTDWICMADCGDRGGRYADCKQRCRLR